MAIYNAQIDRVNAAGLVNPEIATQIIKELPQASAARSLFKTVSMGTTQQKMPVLSTLPLAYFVNGDTGLKQTTTALWTGKTLNAEELAVLVPVPDALLNDAQFDIWGEIRPNVVEAIGRALDQAVFFGTNKPASWDTAIVTAATSASNNVALGTAATNVGGVAADISNLFKTVEADGFGVSGVAANLTMKGNIRNARDSQGRQLGEVSMADWYGVPVNYAMDGSWGSNYAVAGDFTKGILGVRQDITMTATQEAVITDDAGAVIFNSFQQDSTIFRVVFRCAYVLANPVTNAQPTAGSRCAFAVLTA